MSQGTAGTMAQRTVVVDCPTCARKVPFNASSRWRPFCSERCKTIDLGAWAAERYRIVGDAPSDGDDGAAANQSTGRPQRDI